MNRAIKTQFPPDLKKLQKKADRLFQLGRRMQEADKNGFCECITCKKVDHYKRMDGGHFIGKGLTGNLAVRYEKNNVWPQCKRCNLHGKGCYSIYRDELIKIVGEEEVKRLEKKKYETVIFKRELLEKVIEEWKTLKS